MREKGGGGVKQNTENRKSTRLPQQHRDTKDSLDSASHHILYCSVLPYVYCIVWGNMNITITKPKYILQMG